MFTIMEKTVHKHLFATFLAVGFALLFSLVIYPKIAYNRGEDGTPDAPTDLSGTAQEGSVDLTWIASRVSDRDPVISYLVYYSTEKSDEVFIDIESTSTEYTVTDLEPEIEYIFYVVAYNNAGESLESDRINVVPLPVSSGEPLAISTEPTVTTTSTTAQIRWGTNEASSSQVFYGPLDSFYGETTEYNTDSGVTSHNVTITGLVPCSRYWYKAKSFDSQRNFIESLDGEFTTLGCKGGANILDLDTRKVTTASGANIEVSSSSRSILVSVPAAVKSGVSELAVSTAKLEAESVKTELPPLSGKVFAQSQIYEIKAFQNPSTEFDGEFDLPVTITISYTKEDISNININTLKIAHYEDGDGWSELTNCVNDYDKQTETGTITCETRSFSIFTLVGQEEQSNIISSGSLPTQPEVVVVNYENSSSSGGGYSSNNLKEVENVETKEEVEEVKVVSPSVNNSFKITKNLWYGIIDEEVLILQKFLNSVGLILDQKGPGSPGEETNYFGPKTQNALIKFQEIYADKILAPYGLTKGTGFLGEKTREFINSLGQ